MNKLEVHLRKDKAMWVAHCPALDCGSLAPTKKGVLELIKHGLSANLAAYARVIKEDGGFEKLVEVIRVEGPGDKK